MKAQCTKIFNATFLTHKTSEENKMPAKGRTSLTQCVLLMKYLRPIRK